MIGTLEGKLALPPVRHIGIVVRDVEKTAAYYTKTLGVGPFTFSELKLPECLTYGKPDPSRFKIGFASMGSVELEVIQVLEGGRVHADFLNTHGEGLHHLGIFVDDLSLYNKLVAEIDGMGVKRLLDAKLPEGAAVYFETRAVGGVIVELYHSIHGVAS